MKKKGRDGIMFTLVDKRSKEVNEGHEFTHNGETVVLLGGEAPHKKGSTGYVTTTEGRYYAQVYDLKWVIPHVGIEALTKGDSYEIRE
jgi:hypothetical protein